MEKNLTITEKLQMADILVQDAQLSAFELVLDDTTKQFIDDTKEKQDQVLKLKEVNEECLRMVVQL